MPDHVVIATTAHPWDDGRVKTKFAESFLRHGARVTWVGPDRQAFPHSSRDPRIQYHLRTEAGSYTARLSRIPWIVRKVRQQHDADCVYVPDPDLALVASLLRGRQGAKVMFDIHEEYHRGPLRNALGGRRIALAERAMLSAVRGASAQAYLTTSVSDSLVDTYTSPGARRLTVPNTVPSFFLAPTPEKVLSPLRLFHGKATVSHGTPVVIEALRQLDSDDVRVTMFPSPGSATDAPYDPALQQGLTEAVRRRWVERLDAVPLSGMPAVMDQCHAGLIAYGRELGEASVPNRLFEYMARGLAVIAPEYAKDTIRILEKYGCGIAVNFESPSAVADAIRWAHENRSLLHQMGRRGREAIEAEYDWDVIFGRVHQVLSAPTQARRLEA